MQVVENWKSANGKIYGREGSPNPHVLSRARTTAAGSSALRSTASRTPTFRAITAAAADADQIITAARADGANRSTRIVVTVDNGREHTWLGDAWSREEIQDSYGDCRDPAAVEALCRAWQVTLIDPQWARNDHLWAVLRTLGR